MHDRLKKLLGKDADRLEKEFEEMWRKHSDVQDALIARLDRLIGKGGTKS